MSQKSPEIAGRHHDHHLGIIGNNCDDSQVRNAALQPQSPVSQCSHSHLDVTLQSPEDRLGHTAWVSSHWADVRCGVTARLGLDSSHGVSLGDQSWPVQPREAGAASQEMGDTHGCIFQ